MAFNSQIWRIDLLMCDKYAIEEMTRRLSGREDLIKAMIPTTFEVGCRRPTVSLALKLLRALFS